MMSKKYSSSQSAWALLTGSVSEARVEAHRLRHLVNRGQHLVDKSNFRDHLYEVAGDLVLGMPERLSKLEAVLDRTSYALSLMGEEFFKGRLPLGDREMVDEAIRFSQTPFPSSRRVASQFFRRQASRKLGHSIHTLGVDGGEEKVISIINKGLQEGLIDQAEASVALEDVHHIKDRIAAKLWPDTVRFKPSGLPTSMKSKKSKKEYQLPMGIGLIYFTHHAQYRMDLRGVTAVMIRDAARGWTSKMGRGWIDSQEGRNSSNAEFYGKVRSIQGRGSDTYYNPNVNVSWSYQPSRKGTTQNYVLKIVTVFKGQLRGDYRSRVGYSQPASQLPGYQTFVNEKSKSNLPSNTSQSPEENAIERERSGPSSPENKQQALPIRQDHSDKRDKKLPISQTDGKGTSRPQFNAPPDSENAEGGRPIHKDKVRTKSLPGEEYGTPSKDDGYSVTRRTMKSSVQRLTDKFLGV